MPAHFLVKDYLTPETFDVAAKTIFARHFLSEKKMPVGCWAGQVYTEHLRVWNGFSEGDKQGWMRFVSDFGNLLWEMRDGKFDWNRSPIPTRDGKLTNGRHRLAAALVLDQHIRTVEAEDPCDCTYSTLRARGLSSWYLDAMAIEYCRLKTEARIVVVYGPHDRSEIVMDLAPAGRVFYEKMVQLTKPGVLNLIRELYHGEEWLPTSGQGKANASLPDGGVVTFYGLDAHRSHVVAECKADIRFQHDHHFIHINDTHEQTMRLARALLNDNGIHFLNHALPAGVGVPERCIADPELPVDTGSVLAAYGARAASDVDFVSDDMHLEHHHFGLQALRDDPRNFFWSRGVKYASLPTVLAMKIQRGEPKDEADIKLIGEIL